LHVATGFDVSIYGELSLQAFKARQADWPFSIIVFIAVGLIVLFKEPRNLSKYINAIEAGFDKAAELKPFTEIFWDGLWELKAEDAISSLRLTKNQSQERNKKTKRNTTGMISNEITKEPTIHPVQVTI